MSTHETEGPSGTAKQEIEPINVWSAKDLESKFAEMVEAFRGKESEHNWTGREKALNRLRGYLRGNSFANYPDVFMSGTKSLMESLITALLSLRTSLSLTACATVQDLSSYLTIHMDPFVELLFPNLSKMASFTKKLIATASLTATNALLSNTNYHPKLLQHIVTFCMVDKNNQMRHHGMIYTRTIVETHGQKESSAAMMEKHGGVDIILQICRKALEDASPQVREECRNTVWIIIDYWPTKGDAFLRSLDVSVRKQLDRAKPKPGATALLAVRAAVALKNGHDKKTRPLSVTPGANGSNANLSGSTMLSTPTRKPLERAVTDLHETLSTSSTSSNDSQPTKNSSASSRKGPMQRSTSTPMNVPSPSDPRQSKYGSPPASSPPGYRPTSPPATVPRRPTSLLPPSKKSSHSTPKISKKMPLLEMLKHEDPIFRADGIVALAHKVALGEHEILDGPGIFGGRDPIEDKEKVLIPILAGFMAEQGRVFEVLMSHEGIEVLRRCVGFDALVPRLMLITSEPTKGKKEGELARIESAEKGLLILKKLSKEQIETPEMLLNVFVIAGGQGAPPQRRNLGQASKKDAFGNITIPLERRRVTKGTLVWMGEIVQRKLNGSTEEDTKWFSTGSNIKQYLNRLIPVLATTPKENIVYGPLLDLLKQIKQYDARLFVQVLSTFDGSVVGAVKKIMGLKAPELEMITAAMEDVHHAAEEELQEVPSSVTEDISDKNSIDISNAEVGNESGFVMTGEDSSFLLEEQMGSDAIPSPADSRTNSPVRKNFGIQDKSSIGENNAIDKLKHGQDTQRSESPVEISEPKKTQEHDIQLLPSTAQNAAMAARIRASSLVSLGTNPMDLNFTSDAEKRRLSLPQGSPLPKGSKDKRVLMAGLLARLKGEGEDPDASVFRKLVRIVKENPVSADGVATRSPGGTHENIWESGSNFTELVESLLKFLCILKTPPELKENALLLMKQMLIYQTFYFTSFEQRVMIQLLESRSDDSNDVCSAAEDALETFFTVTPPEITLDILFTFLESTLNPENVSIVGLSSVTTTKERVEYYSSLKFHPVGSAFLYLAKVVKKVDRRRVEEGLTAGAGEVIVRGLNDHNVTIRKSSVDAIVALHQVLGDQLFQHLGELNEAQRSLVAHYITVRKNRTG